MRGYTSTTEASHVIAAGGRGHHFNRTAGEAKLVQATKSFLEPI